MLANTKKILDKANKGNYAVGHFNIYNMETVQGVINAAVKLKSPVILATSEGAIKYAGIRFLYDLVETEAELFKVPIALHLDHGKDFNLIKKCIQFGYSSVMVDGSHFPFEKNVKLTKKVVDLAHKKSISVEAELGTIGGVEDSVKAKQIIYTDSDQAKEFIQKTGCDFLAVAIGTSHGAYKFKGTPQLKIGLLKKIKQQIKIPLVLHGASGVPSAVIKQAEKYGAQLEGVKGVPDAQIRLAVKNGINKINTDTDLRLAFDAAVRRVIKTQPQEFDPRHILGPARDYIQKIVEGRIRLFGSKGKGQ